MPRDLRKSAGLVIRQVDFSESSRVVTFFTRDFGKVSVLAKGAKRLKSSFEAAIDLLNQCQIVFIHKPTSQLDLLTEAKLTSRFRAPKHEIQNYYAGLYVAELLNSMSEEFDPHPEWYDEAVSTLSQLESGEDFRTAILRFEWITLEQLGLLPEFDQCQCGRPVEDNAEAWSVWIQQGVLLCSRCRQTDVSSRRLTGHTLVLLRALGTQTTLGDNFSPTIQELRNLRHLMTALISQPLDRRPQMLAYLKY